MVVVRWEEEGWRRMREEGDDFVFTTQIDSNERFEMICRVWKSVRRQSTV